MQALVRLPDQDTKTVRSYFVDGLMGIQTFKLPQISC